ncbi:MAG: hypothetical protein S4CHLAM102_11270 [Chlamydiia bacterium]|nr:hypothetical protein [Chlamydiia bacterium]
MAFSPAMVESFSSICSRERRVRSNRWQRLRIVGRILCASVVAKKNFTLAGGSSRVFKRALNASFVNICTSSMM